MNKYVISLLALAVGLAAEAASVVEIKDSALETESTLALTGNAFSIGAWVKAPRRAGANDAVYIYHTDTAICRIQTNESDLHFMVSQNGTWVKSYASGVTRDVLNDGGWHFIFTTFSYSSSDASASKQRLYVDGVLKAESNVTAPVKAPGYKLTFCARREGESDDKISNTWFSGRIAEVTRWNRALSATEVSALYSHLRVGGKEHGLVSWWPMSGSKPRSGNYSKAKAKEDGLLVNAPCGTAAIVEDGGLESVRYVASPEWIAEKGYVKSADATFRGLDDPATSIQEAIDETSIGETVRLLPGTYPLSTTVTLSGLRITLESYNPQTKTHDCEGTILDGQNNVRILYCSTGASDANPVNLPFLVRGLTFRNGRKSDGNGSVFLRGDATVDADLDQRGGIVDCAFENCTALSSGGALYIYYGGFVSNCTFRSNSAAFGGAIAYYHPSDNFGTYEKTLERAASVPSVCECAFEGNHVAGGAGGAISHRAELNNEYPSSCIIVKDCSFKDNYTADSSRGGTLSLGWNSVVESCHFIGGSAGADSVYGVLVDLRGRSNGNHALFSHNTITGVSSPNNESGLIEVHGKGYTIEDCVVTNNVIGGAIIRVDGDGTGGMVRQCLIADNGDNCQILRGYYTGTARFENCTIVGEGARFTSPSGTQKFEIINSIVSSSSDVESYGLKTFIVKNSLLPNVPGGAEDSGVITGDPRFTDAAKGNYVPRRSSPCRDAALPLEWMTGAKDLSGAPRAVRDGIVRTDNQYVDIGCYENLVKAFGMCLIIR